MSYSIARIAALVATASLAVPTAAPAQTPPPASPAPATTSTYAPAPAAPSGAMPASAMPAASAAPAQTAAPASSGGSSGGSSGNPAPQYKKIRSGSLTPSQTIYGVTHVAQNARKLADMKTVKFDDLRVYHVPTNIKTMLKISDARLVELAILDQQIGTPLLIAQTSVPASNGNNSPLQILHNVLANVNVSDALNNLNVLNNANLNIPITLNNVLNNNKVAIGQVVGLYIGGGGIITTIVK